MCKFGSVTSYEIPHFKMHSRELHGDGDNGVLSDRGNPAGTVKILTGLARKWKKNLRGWAGMGFKSVPVQDCNALI